MSRHASSASHRTSGAAFVVAVLATTAAATAVGTVSAADLAGAGATGAPTTATEPRDALLPARRMPVVNQVQDWEKVAVRHRRVSTAQPARLKALGFEDRARRDVAIPGGEATSVVLTFDDRAGARAAYRAIKRWRSHTGDNIPAGGRLLFTDRRRQVDVPAGRGSYFSFAFKTDKDDVEGTFEWLGVTRRGAAVSVVAWRIDGQDANYEVDPTIASVRTANARLARLG